jgi:hypothetical protein
MRLTFKEKKYKEKSKMKRKNQVRKFPIITKKSQKKHKKQLKKLKKLSKNFINFPISFPKDY